MPPHVVHITVREHPVSFEEVRHVRSCIPLLRVFAQPNSTLTSNGGLGYLDSRPGVTEIGDRVRELVT